MLASAFQRRLLRDDRGQIALAFVALLGLIVLVTPPLMNLGEVARLRTATANAADAGALTGASYASSAANHGARIARYMVWIYWTAQSIFFVPFCWTAAWVAEAIVSAVNIINGWFMVNANSMMYGLFAIGKSAAIFTAVHNSSVDDKTGAVELQIETHQNDLEADPQQTPADQYHYTWVREGIVDEPSELQVDAVYPPRNQAPQLRMSGVPLVYWGWVPGCIPPFFCWPVGWGWNNSTFQGVLIPGLVAGVVALAPWAANKMNVAGVGGYAFLAVVLPAVAGIVAAVGFPGPCLPPTAIAFFFRPRSGNRPNGITFDTGQVAVTVTRRRAGGAQMAFWTMQYPDVVSSATARYTGAHVRLTPFAGPGDRSTAELIAIQ